MMTDDTAVQTLESIKKSLDLLLKLRLREHLEEMTQTEKILYLGELGCSTAEISEYLGIAKTTVAPTLSRANKKRGKKDGV